MEDNSMNDSQSVGGIDRRSLLWALDRLALWGELDGVESADPHVRGEAAASATVTIDQIAWEIRNNNAAVCNTETDQEGGEK